jgi:hypothetical protein
VSKRRTILAQRIRREIAELDRTVVVIQRYWRRAAISGPDQDAFVDAVALNLHAFYSGIEHILEAVAVEVDDGLPRGSAWHAELLDQMSLDLGDSRPAVLTPAQAEMLGEYRRFRHLIRNVYSSNLDPERIDPLVDAIEDRWGDVRRSLIDFAAFLDSTSSSDVAPTVDG